MKKTFAILSLLVIVCMFVPGVAAVANTASPSQSTQAQSNNATIGSSALNTTFKPLTQIPAITEAAANSGSLSTFLNTLYKLCIGAAAALAVLQIMRAGIMYMGPDSISEKREARDLIGWSLFGLLMVLAPVIVFSIIDPRILKLDIDSSLQQIAPPIGDTSGTGQGAGTGTTPATGTGATGTAAAEPGTPPNCNTGFHVAHGQDGDTCEQDTTAPPTGSGGTGTTCDADSVESEGPNGTECTPVNAPIAIYACVPEHQGGGPSYVALSYTKTRVQCSQALINAGELACTGIAVGEWSRQCVMMDLYADAFTREACQAHLSGTALIACDLLQANADIRKSIPVGPLCPGNGGVAGPHFSWGTDAQCR